MAVLKTKKEKLTGPQQVAAFLDQLEHPLKEEIQEVRKIILGAHPQLTEQIKWNAPSFALKGEDRVTFNFHGKDYFRLIFHCGVKVKDVQAQLFDDTTGLLHWLAADRAMAQFSDMKEVREKEGALVEVVNKWIAVAR